MEKTITLTIPAYWLDQQALNQDELLHALRLGLEVLRQKSPELCETPKKVEEVLLSTGQIRHLVMVNADSACLDAPRQPPPTLTGTPVSELLIAQRRGE